MALVSDIDRIIMLMEEIAYAESQLKPQDTGHINTAISWMRNRVTEIKEKSKNENPSYGPPGRR
jgi:hypothetical protein